MPATPLSVVICTLDEEQRLQRCLDAVAWAEEVLVLDCGSTDRTLDIARAAGAVVHAQPWAGFSAQKNAAARLASHDWVLSLDADEVVTPELARAVRAALDAGPDPADGFVLDRRGDFLGRLLGNGTRAAKRKTFVRLYNRTTGGWDETMPVHEVVRVPGRMHPLPGFLLHWNGSSVQDTVALFNRYAGVEADALWERGERATLLDLVLRPVARFLWHYLRFGDVRRGRVGAAHAGMKAVSDFVRYACLLERELREQGRSTDLPARLMEGEWPTARRAPAGASRPGDGWASAPPLESAS